MKGEAGSSILEVLVALALLGILGTSVVMGLGTVSIVTGSTDERETAKNLAETQLEYVKGEAFAASYTPATIPPEYAGYTAAITAATLQDSNIQKVTVTVRHQGIMITTLEGYKTR